MQYSANLHSGSREARRIAAGGWLHPARLSFARQVVVSASDHSDIFYSECLARFSDDLGNPVPTPKVISELEQLHQIVDLDRRAVAATLDQLEKNAGLRLGCNISADNLSDATMWSSLVTQIEARSNLAARLVIELTETQALEVVDLAAEVFPALQALGCQIALDDFGAGFASPDLAEKLDFDILKLDKSFVRRVNKQPHGLNCLRHMVGLASCLAPYVVVEGIESAEEAVIARDLGATHLQGYHFGYPVMFETVQPLHLADASA